MVFIRRFFVSKDDLRPRLTGETDNTFIGQYLIVNPALEGKTIASVAHDTHAHFIISRLWRAGEVILPMADTILHINDSLLVVTNKDDEGAMLMLFGKEMDKDWNKAKIDWNHIDSNVESRVIVLTKAQLNGRSSAVSVCATPTASMSAASSVATSNFLPPTTLCCSMATV